MEIFIVNDDGIAAQGIAALVEVAKIYGNITVVAPDAARSGMSHAVSLDKILRLKEEKRFFNGVKSYSCSGTPVDCVKLGLDQLFKDRLPDLLLSGINHGPNHSINTLYSGTMSAAIEATVAGIPSIAFSLCDFSPEADFSGSKDCAKKLLDIFISKMPDVPLCLNMNVPAIPQSKIKGIKFCRQAKAHWDENFDKRTSPIGMEYFWFNGQYVSDELAEDCDIWAIDNGYASVVPIQYDLTNRTELEKMKLWDGIK